MADQSSDLSVQNIVDLFNSAAVEPLIKHWIKNNRDKHLAMLLNDDSEDTSDDDATSSDSDERDTDSVQAVERITNLAEALINLAGAVANLAVAGNDDDVASTAPKLETVEKGSGRDKPENGRQYLLVNSHSGETVILDAQTFAEVSVKSLPETSMSAIVAVSGIFYSINTAKGEVLCTPVAGLLADETITWSKWTDFPSSDVGWIPNNVAVVGPIVIVMDRTRLIAFDTRSKRVKVEMEMECQENSSIVEADDGNIYCCGLTCLQSTDGRNGWTAIDTPSSVGEFPVCGGSLIKMKDSVCIVGGRCETSLNSVLCYNTKSMSWSIGDPMAKGRSYAATVKLEGRGTLVIGGFDGEEWLDSMEILDEASNTWATDFDKVISRQLSYPQAVTFSCVK